MVKSFPLFYYGGSKHHNLPSDRDFIEKRLNCLSVDSRKLVSEEYTQIFLSHINKGEYRLARFDANTFLDNFVGDIFKMKEEEREANANNHAWISKRIQQVREAQRQARAKIVLD